MLEETYYSDGKDDFKDYTFSVQEWSAPTVVSPEELKQRLFSLNLEGRRIRRMKMIGLIYNLTRNWIEEGAYNHLEKLDEQERQYQSDYEHIDPSIELYRYAEIDEPFLLEFEDGDVLEIDTPQQPEFRVSMNCIPWEIKAGTNNPNAEADILFASCIGEKIKSVEVKSYTTDQDPMFRGYFDENHSIRELISGLVLWLENGQGLLFEGWIDYCHVSLIDEAGDNIPIAFGDLKPGLFNPEDLHTDLFTGYEAQSYSFNFNNLGANHTDQPYMTLIPGDNKTILNISVDDFLLFNWCISIYKKEQFDEYGEYEFTYSEWNEILLLAERLVSFPVFDSLFEYMKSIDITGYRIIGGGTYNVMLNSINCCGAEFWKHIKRYQLQLKDMKKWTELVLSQDENMRIYGF